METIISGIIGAFIGSILAGIFALWAARMQTKAVVEQTLGSTHERLYNANHALLEVLAANPSVRPYFALPAKGVPDEKDKDYSLIFLIAEMHANHLEMASIHMGQLPAVVVGQWKKFIIDQYECSPTLKQYLNDYKGWYSDPLWNILSESPSRRNSQAAKSIASDAQN